jgi:hypothetical protein
MNLHYVSNHWVSLHFLRLSAVDVAADPSQHFTLVQRSTSNIGIAVPTSCALSTSLIYRPPPGKGDTVH